MSFSFIAAVGNYDVTSGTVLDASASLNVAAGDVLVAVCSHQTEGNTSFAVAKDAGSPPNTFVFDAADTIHHSNLDMHSAIGYLLSAAADATATFRLTLGVAKIARSIIVLQFRPDTSEVVTKDASNVAEGTGTAPASGNITTTGTDEIAVGGCVSYNLLATSSEQINSVAATEPVGSPQTTTSAWYRLLTATFANGQASATLGSGDWTCHIIAIKSEAGGPPLLGPSLRTVRSALRW